MRYNRNTGLHRYWVDEWHELHVHCDGDECGWYRSGVGPLGCRHPAAFVCRRDAFSGCGYAAWWGEGWFG